MAAYWPFSREKAYGIDQRLCVHPIHISAYLDFSGRLIPPPPVILYFFFGLETLVPTYFRFFQIPCASRKARVVTDVATHYHKLCGFDMYVFYEHTFFFIAVTMS